MARRSRKPGEMAPCNLTGTELICQLSPPTWLRAAVMAIPREVRARVMNSNRAREVRGWMVVT